MKQKTDISHISVDGINYMYMYTISSFHDSQFTVHIFCFSIHVVCVLCWVDNVNSFSHLCPFFTPKS